MEEAMVPARVPVENRQGKGISYQPRPSREPTDSVQHPLETETGGEICYCGLRVDLYLFVILWTVFSTMVFILALFTLFIMNSCLSVNVACGMKRS